MKTLAEAEKRLFSVEVFSFCKNTDEALCSKGRGGLKLCFWKQVFSQQAGFSGKMAKLFKKQDFSPTLTCFLGNRVDGQPIPLAVS